jgi:site-specific recombinase XerD
MYKYGHVDIRSLQQFLGHESIATTEIFYTHLDDGQLQAAINANPLAMMFS